MSVDAAHARQGLIEFLRTVARPDADVDTVTDEENLVEAGVIDSLAIVEIVMYLETTYVVDVSGIDPTSLVSIAGILGTTDQ